MDKQNIRMDLVALLVLIHESLFSDIQGAT